jgi:hypothetical protein
VRSTLALSCRDQAGSLAQLVRRPHQCAILNVWPSQRLKMLSHASAFSLPAILQLDQSAVRPDRSVLPHRNMRLLLSSQFQGFAVILGSFRCVSSNWG